MHDDQPGIDAWKRETSAFDRVRSIASPVSQPRSASYIADEAHVAENTAREHLERLVDMNVLLKSEQGGASTYSPDPLHTRLQTLRDLIEEHDHDGLIRLKAELQERIQGWRDEYAVDSPDALRERAAETDAAAATREILATANDWELVRYRLDVVEDAIENYATYSRDYRASA
jgi:predicted ArsR family transcriptional regulator